uniref:Uncharacterized protein n=1 Tax=Rhizophora mucronata TaxID=61149 RepID=A0A2P2PA71_RHIMU
MIQNFSNYRIKTCIKNVIFPMNSQMAMSWYL